MKLTHRLTIRRTGVALHKLMFLLAVASQVGLAAAAVPVASAVAGTAQELLEPERAFQLSARYADAKSVELRYKIADGYYMYRARFKFDIDPPTDAKLGKAIFSKGEMKQDPTFGRVQTYRDSVRILLPIASLGKRSGLNEGQPLRLKVTSQGCADAGVCYPPLHQILTLRPASRDVTLSDGSDAGGAQSSNMPVPQSISEAIKKSR